MFSKGKKIISISLYLLVLLFILSIVDNLVMSEKFRVELSIAGTVMLITLFFGVILILISGLINRRD